ncbi:MAG TPA: hypothetical protein VHE30_18375 [Polyangiaceae bacterium]|nr:hypothetical protein [Polyangiaceae bacterium]
MMSLLAARRSVASEPQIVAETLFRRGKTEMDAGNYASGCRDLEESLRLDRAGGTAFTYAVCEERAGNLATAWVAYLDALALAERDGRSDRERLARERAAEMEATAPRFTLQLPEELRRTDGLTITVDGSELARGVWGTGIPVDPGPHRVEVRAPGREPFETTVTAGAARTSLLVPLPVLVEKTAPAPEPPHAAPPPEVPPPEKSAAPPLAVSPARMVPRAPPPAKPGNGLLRTLGFVSGGAGIAMLATGAVFGVRAVSLSGDLCSSRTCPPDQAQDYGAYKTSATAATVTIGAGLLFTGIAAVLLVTQKP